MTVSFRPPRIAASGITGYVVQRTTAESYADQSTSWVQIADARLPQADPIEITDDLSGVSGYAFTARYRIRATTGPDIADPNAAAWAYTRTPILKDRPSRPIDVKSAQRSDGTVEITWGQPAIRQTGVEGYRIERALRTEGAEQVFHPRGLCRRD